MPGVRLFLATALAATLSACGSSTAPPSSLAGQWVATLSGVSEISLQLTVADTTVTGTGALRSVADSSSAPEPLTVSGRFIPPDVWFTIHRPISEVSFSGVLSGATLAGTMSPYPYINYPVVFTKR